MIIESSESDDAIRIISLVLVQCKPQDQAGYNYDLLAEKTYSKDAQGIEYKSDNELVGAEVCIKK